MHVPRPIALALTLILMVPASARAAPDDPPDDHVPRVRPTTPFGRNSIGVEFSGILLVEAWNLNEGREWLAGGNAAIWWAFREPLALIVEMQATRVFQAQPRRGFVQGLAPLLRWQVHRADAWALFVELGPGISWSDTQVPPRGTRFNYLAIGGLGSTHRLGTHSEAIVGFRWLHLSNAGLEGRGRNPDIEALGPYAGIRLSF